MVCKVIFWSDPFRVLLNTNLSFSLLRGHSFFSLNGPLLERYAACANAVEVIEAQNKYLESLANESAATSRSKGSGNDYLDGLDLPSSDESESETDSDSDGDQDPIVDAQQEMSVLQLNS